MKLTRLHKASLNKLCILLYFVLILNRSMYQKRNNENVYMSQGAWRNDTVTQMNQMKDSRVFKKRDAFVFTTDCAVKE